MRARIVKDDGSAILFYTLNAANTNPGMVLSYMHVGQHGEASLGFMRRACRLPITDDEKRACNALLNELGYKPRFKYSRQLLTD